MQTRNTVQRQIVLQTVLHMHDHPTADNVYAAGAGKQLGTSKLPVDSQQNHLAPQGEIRRVPVPNGADRFDFNTSEHYHVRCEKCGAVFDVHMPHINNLIEQVEDASGVEVQRYDILFEGICRDCRTESA